MINSYLTQQLSQYSVVATNVYYLFPISQNLEAGHYASEIVDVKEVLDANGKLVALDFCHKLQDSNGNEIFVRFRYYDKELPSLAQELSKYPQIQTWQNTIGLKEEVVISKKPTGNYLRISSRSASDEAEDASKTSSAGSSIRKKGGSITRYPRHLGNKPSTITKQAVLEEDDEDEEEEDDYDYLDDED